MALSSSAQLCNLGLLQPSVAQLFDDLHPVHVHSVSAFALACKHPCVRSAKHNCAMNTLRERLVAARQAKGLSQGELARRARCGQTTIASIENGRNQSSTFLTVIAEALGVEPLWLAEGRGPRERGSAANESQTSHHAPTHGRDTTPQDADSLNQREKTLLGLFSGLTESQKEDVIRELEAKKQKNDEIISELAHRKA